MSYGVLSKLGIILQDSYGTVGNTDSIHWVPFLSEGVNLQIPPQYHENMRGVFDEGDTYEGPHIIEGDVESEVQIVPLGAMLKAMMTETTVTSDDLYTRTFKPHVDSDWSDKSANQPVTLYKYLDTGSAFLLSDLNLATLELGIAQSELLRVTGSFVGGSFGQTAAVSASLPTGKQLPWDVASISIADTAIDNAVDATITIDDGSLEAQHTLNNSKEPSRIKRTGFRTIAVDITLKFENQDQYQKFIDQDEQNLKLHFEGQTEVQSGYNEGLTIELPAMRYEEVGPAAEGPGEIETTFTARGKYHVGSGTALEITHYSGQESY